MHRFWRLALEPLVEAVAPRQILEIGAESGALTERLLEWAVAHDAVVHSVDPAPQFNVDEWRVRFDDRLLFHRELRRLYATLGRAPRLRMVMTEVETNRLWTEIRRVDTRKRLVERSQAVESLEQEAGALREELDEAQRQLHEIEEAKRALERAE